MSESKPRERRRSSSFHGTSGGKSATKNRASGPRISFRDLAKFASSQKTAFFLVDLTGCDERTAKRWLSGESRAPANALSAVVADIFSRIAQ